VGRLPRGAAKREGRRFRVGRSRKGERAYGKNIPLLGALTTGGILACMQVEEATTGDVFESFVREVLLGRVHVRFRCSDRVRWC
jgi:hypothetical protein